MSSRLEYLRNCTEQERDDECTTEEYNQLEAEFGVSQEDSKLADFLADELNKDAERDHVTTHEIRQVLEKYREALQAGVL